MALQDDDAFTAVHDLAVCLLIPVLHGSAGGGIGALGVDQQLVQVGGVVVMRCRIQEPPPVFRSAVPVGKYLVDLALLHLSGSS